jgi:AraC-like DNA-binding protein
MQQMGHWDDFSEKMIRSGQDLVPGLRVRRVVCRCDKSSASGLGALQYTRYPYFKLVLSGSMTLRTPQQSEVVLRKDDVAFFSGNSYVNLFYEKKVRFLRITMAPNHTHLGIECIDPHHPLIGGAALGALESRSIELPRPALIERLLERMEFWGRDVVDGTAAHLAAVFLAELGRWAAMMSEPAPSLIRRLEQFIALNNHRPINLGSAAENFGLSTRHVTRLLRRNGGASFNARLQAERFAHARELLGSTALPIEQVALACGFTSARYFAQAFRRNEGLSPSQWRRHRLPGTE